MSYTKEELIQYRINRAKESLDEANLLANSRHWNTTINRLYYAVYYAATAYLIKIDKSPGSHSGTKTLFNQELIKSNLLGIDSGKLCQDFSSPQFSYFYTELNKLNVRARRT